MPGDEPEVDLAPDPADEEPLPAPEPLLWTPERAGYVLRGCGLVLHTADSASREPGGEVLWRMTELDLEQMGPPLSAILNRYDAARRLAGYSDEGALAFGMLAYARRNLVDRGRVVATRAEREERESGPEVWADREPPADPTVGLA